MSKLYFVLSHLEARKRAIEAIQNAPEGYLVEVKPKTRSLEQNSRLWAMLTSISKQVDWYGRKLAPEEWKHIFTSALKKQDVVPNLDGTGFVVLGQSTSKMNVKEMLELQELMMAFCVEKEVFLDE